MLGMCNAYEQHVRWVEYTRMMQDLELGIPTQQTELDLPQSDMVRINDMAPVMRAAGNGVELEQMNFSFAPGRPKGGPVFNFRSEGRDFSKSGRCLIPASGFFEFTGTKYPKPNIASHWRDRRSLPLPGSGAKRRAITR